MTTDVTAKIWFINDLEKMLIDGGISHSVSDLITFITTVTILFLLLAGLDFIGSKVVIKIIHHASRKTKSRWDDFLVDQHFFHRTIRFLITLVLVFLIKFLFKGYNDQVVQGVIIATQCFSIFFITSAAWAFVDAVNDIYMTSPRSKEKSIKGYIQTMKIIAVVLAIIVGISILFSVKISTILLSLATSAAILTLVFKDTLLGFVASIQLSVQDMIRLGDWIVIENKGANGVVIDMNVNIVKVLNWDNTVTMVPIYTLISEPFINWRTMEEGDGRRFTIPLHIDVSSIRKIERNELERMETSDFFSEYYTDMMRLKNLYSSEGTTNISLLRAYAEAFLRNNNLINENMTLLVRYLPMSENGVIIQLYGFTFKKAWSDYEAVVAMISEQMFAAILTLDLRLYQRNSNPTTEHLNRPQKLSI